LIISSLTAPNDGLGRVRGGSYPSRFAWSGRIFNCQPF
jgi:hypothetical protein